MFLLTKYMLGKGSAKPFLQYKLTIYIVSLHCRKGFADPFNFFVVSK